MIILADKFNFIENFVSHKPKGLSLVLGVWRLQSSDSSQADALTFEVKYMKATKK